jgi:hypothetical protein
VVNLDSTPLFTEPNWRGIGATLYQDSGKDLDNW